MIKKIRVPATKEAANAWLNKQLAKYQNTYYFPADVKRKLNACIEKHGNTYFWSR